MQWGLRDAKVREINRLSWAICDLQDAGEPEEIWLPLLEKERRIGGADQDEALRVLAFSLAQSSGWPALDLGDGESIVSNEKGWQAFTETAPIEKLQEIVGILEGGASNAASQR